MNASFMAAFMAACGVSISAANTLIGIPQCDDLHYVEYRAFEHAYDATQSLHLDDQTVEMKVSDFV